MNKTALITGIFGQDGSYLCELLFKKSYKVFGIVRETLSENSMKIKNHLEKNNIHPVLFKLNLNNYDDLKKAIIEIEPDEIYHVAAFHVSAQGVSGNKHQYEKQLFDYNIKSTSNILSICYECSKKTKIVLAGSCLMFDNSETQIQNENTSFDSKSLYGLAKITENSLAKYYRSKGLNVSSAILYNHESSRRSDDFVTKKIVKNMVAVKKGEIQKFTLGSINTKKDWGYAKDYAFGMYSMIQQEIADDYILSSGKLHTIKEFIEVCANILNILNWQNHIETDSSIIDRKIDGQLFGDCSKAKEVLNWHNDLELKDLIKLMIENEMNNTLE